MPQEDMYQKLLDQSEANGTARNVAAGPRVKSFATKEWEDLSRKLMDPESRKNAVVIYNARKELEVRIDGKLFNVTEILKNKPDFEQLDFNKGQMDEYAKFAMRKGVINKPLLKTTNGVSKNNPSPEDYTQNDPENKHGFLNYGEKLAISIYSGNAYSIINEFLRNDAMVDTLRDTQNPEVLKMQAIELILCSSMAAHGLRQDPEIQHEIVDDNATDKQVEKKPALIRMERKFRPVHQDRESGIEKKIISEIKGFMSTSLPDVSFGNYEVKIFYTTTAHGKDIKELSKNPDEAEILFMPGVEVQYQAIIEEGNVINILATPVRSVENTDQYYFKYTNKEKIEGQIRAINNEIIKLKSPEKEQVKGLLTPMNFKDINSSDLESKMQQLNSMKASMSEVQKKSLQGVSDRLGFLITEAKDYEKAKKIGAGEIFEQEEKQELSQKVVAAPPKAEQPTTQVKVKQEEEKKVIEEPKKATTPKVEEVKKVLKSSPSHTEQKKQAPEEHKVIAMKNQEFKQKFQAKITSLKQDKPAVEPVYEQAKAQNPDKLSFKERLALFNKNDEEKNTTTITIRPKWTNH